MKIKKSELYKLIQESIENGIYSYLTESNDDVINHVKNNVMNHIRGRINGTIPTNNDDNYIEDITTIGINPNFNNKDRRKIKSSYFNDNFEGNLRDKIVDSAFILHKYANKRTHSFNFEAMYNDCKNSPDGKINGFTYSDLVNHKELLDSKGFEYLYENDSDEIRKKFKLDLKTLGDLNKYTKTDTDVYEEVYGIAKMRETFLNNYMEKTYGLDVDLPNEVFTKGNKKLPNDMLIINFTGAMKCPAWNECLIKTACYARSDEKQYRNTRNANVYRNLMWRTSFNDEKLTTMIYQLIKLYSIDYKSALKEILKLNKTLNEDNNIKTKSDKLINNYSLKNFSELNENELEILKKYRRITTIRLNESGDFIGDWLVNKINDMARDLSLIDITCSAYTCRHLSSIQNVSNIIINSSNISNNGESVKRYFIALSANLFDCFEDTYNNYNNKKVDKTKFIIKYAPQPLYDFNNTGQLNGNYFYKCPCDSNNLNCYNCKMCYSSENSLPENSNSDSILYVFVKAHGSSKNKLNNSNILKKIGVTPTFLSKYNEIKKKKEMNILSENNIHENIKNGISGGIKNIANNCINSIKTHLNDLSYNT